MGLFSGRRPSQRRSLHRSYRPRIEQLEARQMLAAADLTAWAGVGNITSPNNYSVISSTSAGGTFDGRRFGAGEAAAYLADAALLTPAGAALPDLNRTTTGGFGATGTITFDASANANIVDPVFYFGFFDNENLAQGAFGFSIADQTSTSFRFRATAGTTQGSTVVLAQGTYTYDIDVNNAESGANTVRVRIFSGATTVVNVTVAIPTTLALQADTFGFLQPLAASDSDNTFSMTVSNINYTGETQVSGSTPAAPTSLAATAAGSTQINLTWTDNANNETGFEIDRATNSTFTAGLTTSTAAANATSFSATGLAASTTYYFRVRATNAVGDSANSNTASAATLPVSGSAFYLDLDSGSDAATGLTAGTAWRTMDKAIRSAPNNSTVFITAGTYSENQTTLLTAPVRTGMVTFKPVSGAAVTISGAIDWQFVTHVRLEGLKFTKLVQLRDTAQFQFVNNEMTGSGGLAIYGIEGGLIENNHIHDTTNSNAILLRAYNIYLGENDYRHWRADNVVISNNLLENLRDADGIHVENAANITIKNNDIIGIQDTGIGAHIDSIQLVEVSDSLIDGNLMKFSRGIIVHHRLNANGTPVDTPTSPYIPGINHHLTFTNNIHTGSVWALKVNEAPFLTVVNNTFWGTSTSNGGSGLIIGTNSTNVTMANNLLRVLYLNPAVTFAVRGYNLINLLQNGATRVATEIGGTPNFVNLAAKDVHLLAGSLGINQGTTGTFVPTLDRDGNVRVGPPDMGAYEYGA